MPAFKLKKWTVVALVSLASWATSSDLRAAPAKPLVLSCPVTRIRVQQFLDQHYAFRSFDNELSRRTFKRLFDSFDPGKYFFLASDVAQFQNIEDQIDDMIGRADCKFLFDIQDIFKKRFKERQAHVMTLLAKPFTFDAAEDILVDRTKIGWAKDNADLDERWRKRIKFQVLGMKEGVTESEAREKIKKRYAQVEKHQDELTSDDMFSLFLNAFATALDPHSSYFLPNDSEDFAIRLSNQLEGIGATLTENNGYITIEALVPGGAAHRDGRLKAGDKIIGVDSGDGVGMQDVIDMDLSKAVRLIRGKRGTTVKLLILRKNDTGENERSTFALVRDVVKFTSKEARSDLTEVRGKKIGVIRLPSFYSDYNCKGKPRTECDGASSHTLRELKKLLAKNVDGVILDLRSDGGGDLQESIRLSGLFIPEGTVVQTVDRKRSTRAFQDNDPAVSYAGPFAVMINKQSASASEIVAGAMQDWGRALIIGDSHTYGKGTVQIVQDLPGSDGRQSDGAIKVTQSKFYRPSGRSNQEKGIESDLLIPSLLEIDDVGEKENDFVLPWDSIRPAADFKPILNFAAVVPKLAAQSTERISKDKKFIELKEKMEKFKKEKEKGTASLKDEKKATPTPTPVADKKKDGKKDAKKDEKKLLTDDEIPVIQKEDIALTEAANILVDAMGALGTTWVAGAMQLKPGDLKSP